MICFEKKHLLTVRYFCPFNLWPLRVTNILFLHAIFTPETNVKATRIEEMITNLRSSWLLNKLSLLVTKKTYREQSGE